MNEIVRATATTLWLQLTLLSDTTFGRGDGVAGEVDDEIQHDELGLPFLNGKTLKGLLGAECAEILFSLTQIGIDLAGWRESSQRLFGQPGSAVVDSGLLHVGMARLPSALRNVIASDFERCSAELRSKHVPRSDIEIALGRMRRANLSSLTAERRQTAISANGAPQKETLRTLRVLLRQTMFETELQFAGAMTQHDQMLLSACVRSLRRAGSGRNRGRGHVQALLLDQPPDSTSGARSIDNSIGARWFAAFKTFLQTNTPQITTPPSRGA